MRGMREMLRPHAASGAAVEVRAVTVVDEAAARLGAHEQPVDVDLQFGARGCEGGARGVEGV